MPKVSGHGGYFVIAGSPNVIAHNAEYEADIEGIHDDVTTSGSGGWAEGLPILKKVNSVTIRMPEDDTAYLETLTLTENTVLSIWLKRGASAVYDKVNNTIVRNVRIMNNQQQARRLEVTTEYGTFARAAVAPA